MADLDILFIGAVMNYDGSVGSLANFIRRDDRWIAPFQYIYEKRPHNFKSEADACVYSVPNLSICSLVDYLKRRMDLKYHIIWHFDYHKDEILDLLANTPPKLVAISTTLAFYPKYLDDCVAWVNEHKQPETKIVLGGKWIYDRYKAFGLGPKLEEIFSQTNADYFVVNSFGEETLYRLLLAEKQGDQGMAQRLPSVSYRADETVSGTGTDGVGYPGRYYWMNHVVEEDQTPGSPMIDFTHIGERFLGDVVHLRTASSCPFKCRFCTFPVLQGAHILFDVDEVIVQLKQLKSLGVRYLFFIDDTFNVPRRRFDDLMGRMIHEDLGLEWVSFFRAQYADADLVAKMHDAGCRMVFCGFESGNNEILERMNKKVTVQQYEAGLEYLDRAGIEVLASYIVGYPGETYETAMDTLQLLNHPRVSFSRGSLFYYERNAPVSQFAEEYGLVGSGTEWRHNTMNSQEAAKIHFEIIDRLRGVNVPVSDGGGWNLFHFFARGISFEDQKTLFREFTTIQKEQIKEAGSEAFAHYRAAAKKSPRRLRSEPESTAGNAKDGPRIPEMSF